jgi:hypothetical protein
MEYNYECFYCLNSEYGDDSSLDANELEQKKQSDAGFNRFWKNIKRVNNVNNDLLPNRRQRKNKRVKFEVYTSGDAGHSIRDAETGEYYPYLVGSSDELLFFKVGLCNGLCQSKNGSNTLFYVSPEKYASHLRKNLRQLNPELLSNWKQRRDMRIQAMKSFVPKKYAASYVEVK